MGLQPTTHVHVVIEHLLDVPALLFGQVKKRVLEYLAVCQLTRALRGPILCLVGAPGVGKTSIGRSVAKTLGRKFHRYIDFIFIHVHT